MRENNRVLRVSTQCFSGLDTHADDVHSHSVTGVSFSFDGEFIAISSQGPFIDIVSMLPYLVLVSCTYASTVCDRNRCIAASCSYIVSFTNSLLASVQVPVCILRADEGGATHGSCQPLRAGCMIGFHIS